MTTSHLGSPTTLVARCPEDLLAVARVVLGFEPAGSIVMLTVGPRPFHARVDLPSAEDDLDLVCASLVDPAVRHRTRATVLLLYAADPAGARRAVRRLRGALEHAGVGVLDALRVHEGRWYPLLRDRRGLGTSGVPYDVSAHPFVTAAVVEGRVLHRSREDLAATVGPVPEQVAAVQAARPTRSLDPGLVAAWVAQHVAAGTTPDPGRAARLLEAVADPLARAAAWGDLRRQGARDHVRLWSGLVQRAPEDLVPDAASLLALAAWVAGDGALAWCAVDRARLVDPGHPLADLVARLLLDAVPPSAWEEVATRRAEP